MADKTISKNEAVRLAIVELGQQATRGQIQAFVKERFGFEMSPNHVSVARVAALRKLQAAPQPEAQPAAAPAPARGTKNGGPPAASPQPAEGEKVTKKEAVRRALAALGKDAKPIAIQGWVKDNLAIDMTTDHISTTKGELLRKARKKPAARKPAASPQPPGQAAPALPAVKVANAKRSAVEMADILTLKDLVRRVGAAHLRTLIDVISR
jgi:hypothetical protein